MKIKPGHYYLTSEGNMVQGVQSHVPGHQYIKGRVSGINKTHEVTPRIGSILTANGQGVFPTVRSHIGRPVPFRKALHRGWLKAGMVVFLKIYRGILDSGGEYVKHKIVIKRLADNDYMAFGNPLTGSVVALSDVTPYSKIIVAEPKEGFKKPNKKHGKPDWKVVPKDKELEGKWERVSLDEKTDAVRKILPVKTHHERSYMINSVGDLVRAEKTYGHVNLTFTKVDGVVDKSSMKLINLCT